MKPRLIPAGLVLLISLASVCAAAPSASAQAPVKKTVGQFLNMSDSDTTWCELTGVVNRIRNNADIIRPKNTNRLHCECCSTMQAAR